MFEFIRNKKNHSFMRLWLAQLISQFGDRINQMALIGLIAERTPGSTLGLAKLLSFTIIPVFIIGPLAGVLVDRWDKRTTLFVCDLIRGFLVLLIPFVFIYWHSIIPIYILVFFVFSFSRFYVPAKMSIIPQLVGQENLLVANSLITTTGMLAFVLGCALGGYLVDAFGSRGGFIIDATTFFFSAVMIISIPKNIRLHFDHKKIIETSQEVIRIERSILSELKEGLLYLFRNRGLNFVIGMLFILLAGAGAIYVVIIVFIQEAFNSVTRDLGFLAVFLGGGLFAGALLYGKWGKRFAWHKTIFTCLMAAGVMLIVFASMVRIYPNLILAAGLGFLLGLVIGPIFIAANTLAIIVSDEKMRGKVFAALEVIIHFAFLIAMLGSSLLCEFLDRLWILVGVAVLFSFIGLFGLIRYKNSPALALGGEKMA